MEREVLAELNPNMKMGNRNASRSGSTNLVEVHISNLEKDKGADVCIGDNDKGILINVDANEEEYQITIQQNISKTLQIPIRLRMLTLLLIRIQYIIKIVNNHPRER